MRTLLSNCCLKMVLALIVLVYAAGHASAGVEDISSLALWLKADGSMTKDVNGYVSVWNDTPGNGGINSTVNNAVRAQAGKQPLYVENVFGNKPGLYFDGVDDHLSIPSSVFAGTDNAFTIYFVVRTADVSGGLYSWYSNHAYYSPGLLFYNGKISFDLIYGNYGNTVTTDTYNDDTPVIITATYDNTEKKLYINDLLKVTTPQTGNIGSGFNSNTIGVLALDSNDGNPLALDKYGLVNKYFQGYIAEVIIFKSVLDDADRATVSAHLASYVPEPASALTLLFGSLAFGFVRRKH